MIVSRRDVPAGRLCHIYFRIWACAFPNFSLSSKYPTASNFSHLIIPYEVFFSYRSDRIHDRILRGLYSNSIWNIIVFRITNFLLLTIGLLLCVTTRCLRNKNPVAPLDFRELTWTIDTLSHPDNWQSSVSDIWGSSAKNVYVVGDGNTPQGNLWRYQGKQFEEIKMGAYDGGPITGNFEFDDIFGFGSNNIWVCGANIELNPSPPPNILAHSLVIHYNGAQWSVASIPEGRYLTSIWGPNENNVWFAGINGVLFHWDGSIFQSHSLPLNIPIDADPFFTPKALTGNDTLTCMLLGDHNSIPPRVILLENRGQGWTVTDSTFYFDSSRIWMSPSGILYATGSSIYRRINGVWELFLDGQGTLRSGSIFGTGDDNLFAVGRPTDRHIEGVIYHYNGNDWQHLEELDSDEYRYREGWTDGKEVFITGTNGADTIVVHGKRD